MESIAIMQKVLKNDSNCIDIGCHKGEIMDKILELAANGQHYGFEPLPDFYNNLLAKYKARKNISILPYALSNEAGETEFVYVKSNPAYSGIRQRKFDRAHEDLQKIKVEKAKLGEIVPADMPIHLIKIDVEGGEYGVLQGAEEILRKWQPYIIFEHGLGAADCYNTKPEMIFDLLLSYGLNISNLDQYLLEKASLTKSEFCAQFQQGVHYYFIAHP